MNKSWKVVVVIGASQGIGAEVVRAFRKRDYCIVATRRSIKLSDDPNILSIAGDIGGPTTAQWAISEGVARFGRIDTLVNNAGIYIGKPFTERTAEDYAAVMNVNMAGFYHITQLAIAEMEMHSSGHVVSATTSIDHAAISGIYSVLAAMTKGGINAATKSLAIEYAKKGIRVNAVAPENVNTPMHAREKSRSAGSFPTYRTHG
jgi:NAD(P)-dependent dehydrogenase (short-subunit alcohol dehydrogenase family)